MEFEEILYEKRDNIAYVTFNKPERLNTITLRTVKELTYAMNDVDEDNTIAAVVASGKGKAFCVGGDLSVFKEISLKSGRDIAEQCQRLASAMRGMGKPIIASVHGFCMGWGLEFVTFCDLAIASEDAEFEQTELKIGSCPMFGATQMFPLLMGDKRAREAIFLSKRFSAKEAADWGLINKVVPTEKLGEETDRWCRRILSMSPQSTRVAKTALGILPDLLMSALRHGLVIGPMLWVSPEGREAMNAFMEKRKPDFMQFRK